MREWLIDLRRQKGYTQKDVADAVGISRNYYSEIEKGKSLRGKVAYDIAKFLNFKMEKFYEKR
ncbi:helix-turn-helix transcriptional regulator [Ectobacillus antri]|uniref:helix-turn-helix transcriptional regulator n=1 Tax=Ectobacillus antri TaxID=2486280 RepID=UPI0013DDE1FF|nr:helix-turn-helix transcriptional regulator [Ectobacillus antri]